LDKEDSSGTSGSGEFSSLQQLEEEVLLEEEEEEEINSLSSDVWKTQKRHVFILSESGKPIYSRWVTRLPF